MDDSLGGGNVTSDKKKFSSLEKLGGARADRARKRHGHGVCALKGHLKAEYVGIR